MSTLFKKITETQKDSLTADELRQSNMLGVGIVLGLSFLGFVVGRLTKR